MREDAAINKTKLKTTQDRRSFGQKTSVKDSLKQRRSNEVREKREGERAGWGETLNSVNLSKS